MAAGQNVHSCRSRSSVSLYRKHVTCVMLLPLFGGCIIRRLSSSSDAIGHVHRQSVAHLTQSQVDRGRLGDVHDLPVGCHYEDEAVQSLKEEIYLISYWGS